MNCPKCTKEISENAVFCTNCGNPLLETASQIKIEDYGLKNKISIWNVYQIKNPELYGGHGKTMFTLLIFVSLIWIIGLVLFIINIKTNSVVKKYQAKSYLLASIMGFLLMLMVAGNDNGNNKTIGASPPTDKVIVDANKDTATASNDNNNYSSDRDTAKYINDCKSTVYDSIVGKAFTATVHQRPSSSHSYTASMPVSFSSAPEGGEDFNVKSPENFTVIRRAKDIPLGGTLYEIKFESGKVGYVDDDAFYALSDGPDIPQEARACYQNTK